MFDFIDAETTPVAFDAIYLTISIELFGSGIGSTRIIASIIGHP